MSIDSNPSGFILKKDSYALFKTPICSAWNNVNINPAIKTIGVYEYLLYYLIVLRIPPIKSATAIRITSPDSKGISSSSSPCPSTKSKVSYVDASALSSDSNNL